MSIIEDDYLTKKKDKNANVSKENWKDFGNALTKSMIFIIFGVWIVGSMGLYTSKVVQSGILPDDIRLKPFGETNIQYYINSTTQSVNSLPNIYTNVFINNSIGQSMTFNVDSIIKIYEKTLSYVTPNNDSSIFLIYLYEVIKTLLVVNNKIVVALFGLLIPSGNIPL